MAGRYSCDNIWLECYDNQAAARDYLCRMKLEEFYTTGAYCLNSTENKIPQRSASLGVVSPHEPEQEAMHLIDSDLISGGNGYSLPPATGQTRGPWSRCCLIVRGLIGFKNYSTPLKFPKPALDVTYSMGANGTPSYTRRW